MWITVILHPTKMQRKLNRNIKERKKRKKIEKNRKYSLPAILATFKLISNSSQGQVNGSQKNQKLPSLPPYTWKEQLESRKITRFIPQHFYLAQSAASTSLLEGLSIRLLTPSLSWRDTHTPHCSPSEFAPAIPRLTLPQGWMWPTEQRLIH